MKKLEKKDLFEIRGGDGHKVGSGVVDVIVE
jgi:hypothetical protein